MSEPMTRLSETTPAAGVLTAGLAKPAAEGGRLPTQDELPDDDGEPRESERHLYQLPLLIETLKLHWAGRDDFFAGGNMFVYFSPAQVKHNDFRGPDFFVALGVDGKRERKSWVKWEEGKLPDLVIEFLSESTADFDRTGKKQIYQDQMQVQEYFYYDPFSAEFAGFSLSSNGYQPLAPDARHRLISPVTGLALARWEGEYLGVTANWLRWETPDGQLLPTGKELAQQAQQRAERLAARLRELGVDPATLD